MRPPQGTCVELIRRHGTALSKGSKASTSGLQMFWFASSLALSNLPPSLPEALAILSYIHGLGLLGLGLEN